MFNWGWIFVVVFGIAFYVVDKKGLYDLVPIFFCLFLSFFCVLF